MRIQFFHGSIQDKLVWTCGLNSEQHGSSISLDYVVELFPKHELEPFG